MRNLITIKSDDPALNDKVATADNLQDGMWLKQQIGNLTFNWRYDVEYQKKHAHVPSGIDNDMSKKPSTMPNPFVIDLFKQAQGTNIVYDQQQASILLLTNEQKCKLIYSTN